MSELVLKQKFEPIQLFTENNIDPLLEAITDEVKSFEPDMTTAKGRKAIASLARKVSSSKTHLDDLGGGLTEEWRKKTDAVNVTRRKPKKEHEKKKGNTFNVKKNRKPPRLPSVN